MIPSDRTRVKSSEAAPSLRGRTSSPRTLPEHSAEVILRQWIESTESLHAAVLSLDLQGNLVGWSKGAEALSGFASREVIGKPFSTLFGNDRPLALATLERCEIEVPLLKNSGELLQVHLSLGILPDPKGRPVGIAGFLIDVTERKRTEATLRAGLERFQRAAETVDALVYEVDLETGQTYRSAGMVAVLGFHPEEVPADPEWWHRRIHPDDLTRVRAEKDGALASKDFSDVDYRILNRRGDFVFVWDRAAIVRNANGKPIRLVGCTVNITELQKAQEKLRESEERHRLLSELTSDYAYTCRVDVDQTVHLESATEGFIRVTGFTVEELNARGGWEALIHPLDLVAVFQRMPQLLVGQRDVRELRILTKSGEIRWIRYSTHPIWDTIRGRVVRLLGAVKDITERKRDEEKLQEYAQSLQALSQRLLQVQESERRHLARELHDEVAQALTVLNLTLEMSLRQEGEPLRASLAEAQAQVKELTTRVRDLSLRLRPTMLDDLGLLPALVWLFQRYSAQTRVQIDFQHSGLARRFRPEVETAAYRIVQEALTNVARHARVHAATVRLWLDRDRLWVQIEDRGFGFDLEQVANLGTSSGLSGMKERARLLGGNLVVESVPGSGTCLTAELPLSPDEEKQVHAPDAASGG